MSTKIDKWRETEGQLNHWERVRKNAGKFGLCSKCACAMAYAHQQNFNRLEGRPPCENCKPLLAKLPVEKPHGWRTVEGRANAASAWKV